MKDKTGMTEVSGRRGHVKQCSEGRQGHVIGGMEVEGHSLLTDCF